MGLLDRLRGRRGASASAQAEPPAVSAALLGGQDDLEVVGELAYQDALWRLCGGTIGDRIRCDIVAVLVPEPTNPHDANAVSVQIDGQTVGYLSRATAQEYLPGLKHVMSGRGGYVALRGVIVGGGYYGLALYGQRTARQEAVEDLIKRRNRAMAKLETAATPRRQARPDDPAGPL